MTNIHLKRYYKYLTEDITLEVSDKIAALLPYQTWALIPVIAGRPA